MSYSRYDLGSVLVARNRSRVSALLFKIKLLNYLITKIQSFIYLCFSKF